MIEFSAHVSKDQLLIGDLIRVEIECPLHPKARYFYPKNKMDRLGGVNHHTVETLIMMHAIKRHEREHEAIRRRQRKSRKRAKWITL